MTSTRFLPTVLLFVTLLIPVAATAQRSGSTIASERILEAIAVREGATVCEIGAGAGALSLAAARLVGQSGRVYTSELGEARVKTLQQRVAASGLSQITVVAGDAARTNFPDAACDALFMRDVYHHLTDPAAMNLSIAAAVKPGARVVIMDFTPPGGEASCPSDRSKDGMHGVTSATVSREMKEAGFEPVDTNVSSQRWFLLVFAKAGTSANP